MNKVERIKLVRAMEYIARQVNDEDVFELWLTEGVADGDIEYGKMEADDADLEKDRWSGLNFYVEDSNFSDLMETFLTLMRKAQKSGGLYCDGVVSGSDKQKDYR